MKLLIDADYIVYKACAGAEDEIDWGDDVITVISSFSDAMAFVERDLRKIKNEFIIFAKQKIRLTIKSI